MVPPLPLLRLVAHRVPPGWAGAVLRTTRRVPLQRPVDRFEREGRAPLPVYPHLRDFGKDRWRLVWWPTRGLIALRRRGVPLAPEVAELLDELDAARTLPHPLSVYADVLEPAAREHPGFFERLDREDARLGRRPLVAVPREAELETSVSMYRLGAASVLADLRACGLEPERARMLEIGCGRGYMSAAVAGAGAAEVHGIDVDVVGESSPSEVAAMHERLGAGRGAAIAAADAGGLSFPDGYFDAVFSIAVVEHLVDLPDVLAETRRVLAPGGLAYHTVDPWFGPAGGHSLCTLDAPWGHVRLDGDEFARYVRQFRPHEAEDAIAYWRDGFQRRRLTLDETVAAARDAGFEVVEATRTPLTLRSVHRGWFSATVLRDCRRVHPAVRVADLLALTTKLVLRRR